MSYLLTEGELTIPCDQLLSSVWYSDGSGARGFGTGLESTPDGWDVQSVRLYQGFVIISIRRKDLVT